MIAFLLVSGICSAVERLLLAAIQFRQSPGTTPVFGLLTLVLDGLKLFGKASADNQARIGMQVMLLSLPMIVLVPLSSLVRVSHGDKYVDGSKIIALLLLLLLLELTEFLVTQTTNNHFVSLALLRSVVLFCITEVS